MNKDSKASKLPAPRKGMKPHTEGVPGELLMSVPPGLVFGNKARRSPYDPLLDRLCEATDAALAKGQPRPALRFGDVRARASVWARGKKKGLRMTYAEAGGQLYVRLEGHVDDDLRGSRRERIHGILKIQPGLSAIAIAKLLREKGDGTIDAMLIEAILAQMQKAGEVVNAEGNVWRLNPTWKGRPAA